MYRARLSLEICMHWLTRNTYEWMRCTRHNRLHLKWFRIGFRNGAWTCRFRKYKWQFPYYPYLAFQDIEGYLNAGNFIPTPGMTVVDIGGCYGEYSLFASALVGPTGRVIMVEPDAGNIEKAKHLFAMNGDPQNITIFEGGIWGTRGTLRFDAGLGPQSMVTALAGHLKGATAERAAPSTEIKVHSLASLVAEMNLDRLDIVKMDVEGAELQVISGAKDLPDRLRPRYAIASYHVVDGRRTAETLGGLFDALPYHHATGNERHLTTWAWPYPDHAGR
jgi:FkbM family methyltransferase